MLISAQKHHEVAHSSHFTNTSNSFWVVLLVAESNAYFATGEPHGNANSTNAGIIAVAESWAEHVSLTFADKKYGNNAWFKPNPTSYNALLEKTRNEMADHIPIGLYHDLIDGINVYEHAGDGSWGTTNVGTINDNVSGLTNAQLFNLLDANTTSPSIFIQKVNNTLIQAPNTTTDVNNLFNSY